MGTSLRSVPRLGDARSSARGGVWGVALACVAVLSLVTACATPRAVVPVDPVRTSLLIDQGDPQRRASLRLIVSGLEADAAGQSERALASYQRAIQIDANNPYAYIALARHWIEAGESERGVSFLDQAEVLLESHSENTLGAQIHLIGLRGRAAATSGSALRADSLLERAAELAPEIWGDGILSADELR